MGPFNKKNVTAPTRSRIATVRFFIHTRKKVISFIILFLSQISAAMETGSGTILSAEEAARLGYEAAAAAAAASAAAVAVAVAVAAAVAAPGAAAANLKKKLLTNKASGNQPLPTFSCIVLVQTANQPIPPSERSKLIRINRELKNKPTVLGGGGGDVPLPLPG
jgi:hypothetical protein